MRTRTRDDPMETLPALVKKVQRDVSEEIDRVVADCSQPDWNGEGSAAISPASVRNVKRFIARLDLTARPIPDVIPEPDGDLALEWHRDDSRWVIASFCPDGSVTYACRMGEGNKATGTSRSTDEFARLVGGFLALVYPE